MQVHIWLQHSVFDKSCIVYIPAGMKHCSLNMKRMDRPLFHFSMGFTSSYDHTVFEGEGKYTGQDMNNFFVFHDHELNGEVELWVEGKKYIIDKSFSATIPEGVEHGPLTIRNVTKPIFHYTAGPGQVYI